MISNFSRFAPFACFAIKKTIAKYQAHLVVYVALNFKFKTIYLQANYFTCFARNAISNCSYLFTVKVGNSET